MNGIYGTAPGGLISQYIEQATDWLAEAESSASDARSGAQHAQLSTALAQAYATLAVGDAISELTHVIAAKFSETELS